MVNFALHLSAVVVLLRWILVPTCIVTAPFLLSAPYPVPIRSVLLGVAALAMLRIVVSAKPGLIKYSQVLRGETKDWVLLVFCLALFSFELSAKWLTGEDGGGAALGGFIPWSDARAYFDGLNRFLEFGDINHFNSRRPLNVLMLSSLNQLLGRDLVRTVFALNVLMAISAFFAARSVSWRYGLIPGTLVAYLLFLFCRWTAIGYFQSEPVGFILGTLSYPFFQLAVEQRRHDSFQLGFLLLALGLFARAGAMFVLPALMVYAAVFFREKGRLFCWRSLLTSNALLVGVWLFGYLAVKVLGESDDSGFGNFSFTLYGILAGAKGWQYIGQVHPELDALPPPIRNARIYELCWGLFKENPLRIFNTLDEAFRVSPFGSQFLSFTRSYWFVSVQVFALVHLGCTAFRRLRDSLGVFLLLVLAMVCISAPMLVDGGPRIYAATVVFSCVICGYGLGRGLQWGESRVHFSRAKESLPGSPSLRGASILAIMLGCLLMIGPVISLLTVPRRTFVAPACEKGQTGMVVTRESWAWLRLGRATMDQGVRDLTLAQAGATNIDFNNTRPLRNMKAGEVLLLALDFVTRKSRLLIVPEEFVLGTETVKKVCVTLLTPHGTLARLESVQ